MARGLRSGNCGLVVMIRHFLLLLADEVDGRRLETGHSEVLPEGCSPRQIRILQGRISG